MEESIPANPEPKFWSAEFHLRFFPRLLWGQIKNHPDSRKRHVLFEIPIAVAVCGFLMAMGFPGAINRHSILGWALVLLGLGGLIALLVACLRGTAGTTLDYSEFEPWTFLFLAALGAVGGFIGGNFLGFLWTKGLGAFLGLALGYFLGIPAGLWLQRFGPLRAFVALASGFGLLTVVGTSLIYLLYIQKK